MCQAYAERFVDEFNHATDNLDEIRDDQLLFNDAFLIKEMVVEFISLCDFRRGTSLLPLRFPRGMTTKESCRDFLLY